jgi:uncharacterized repeat protein (TIGR01451 family)
MKRSDFLALLVFVLLIVALATMQGSLLILAIPLVLYLMYGMWSLPEGSDLDISRSLSAERIDPHDRVTVTITIHNRGMDLTEVLIEDVLPRGLILHSGSSRHLFTLPQGSTTVFEYVVSGPRGSYPFESVRVEVGDSLGLTRHIENVSMLGQLFIVPSVLRLKHIAIRPRRTRVYAGDIPARVGGSGTEFHGVRDYQPGDSSRTINWRISARHGAMYSNEFQQERVADVGIVLDGRKRSNLFAGDRSIFDHSVMAVAALADVFLTQGNRVGLVVHSAYLDSTFPGYGKVQRERILQALMRAHIGDSVAFVGLQRLSPRVFPVESQIVLVSPLIANPLLADDFDMLVQWRARGYQVLVISPDPVSFELSVLPSVPEATLAARVVHLERGLLVHRLQRAGIHVIEWDVTKPFDQAVGPYLSRPLFAPSIGRML